VQQTGLPHPSLGWCNKLVFLTRHLAATSKTKYNYKQTQKNLKKTINENYKHKQN